MAVCQTLSLQYGVSVSLTIGVFTVIAKGRVRSEVVDRIRGNSPSFVLAFSFFVEFSFWGACGGRVRVLQMKSKIQNEGCFAS